MRLSAVSIVRCRSPFTSTTTASSPNCRVNSVLAFAVSEELETSVSVPATGSSLSASASPAIARTQTTAMGSTGLATSLSTTTPNRLPSLTRSP